MQKHFVVEVLGLSFVTLAEVRFGEFVDLDDGPEGGYDKLRFTVLALDAKQARERVLRAMTSLIQDEVNGDIARREYEVE